jgi:phosphoserine aminotransferase
VHYTPNETIDGIEFQWVPETGSVPLVADMTSMILSRPIDVNAFGLIYAGAQKNIGQAGISVAIIRDDLLKEPLSGTPTLYNYKIQADNKSFYNTPPTYSWYIAGLVLAWMKRKGGIKYFAELNERKAKKLYSFLRENNGFYTTRIRPDCQSWMNVVFDLPSLDLTHRFLELAAERGLLNLKNHRLASGVRASIYNAMPEEGVDALIEVMKEFMKNNG